MRSASLSIHTPKVTWKSRREAVTRLERALAARKPAEREVEPESSVEPTFRGKRGKTAPEVGVAKLLKRWSGRRDSNPRRPAWEIDSRLKIQNLAFMVSMARDNKQPSFNDLFHALPKRNKSGTNSESLVPDSAPNVKPTIHRYTPAHRCWSG
jgi:hypothetical protein